MDRSSAREAPPLRQPRESVHSGAAWPPATGATAALQTNRWSASTARPASEGVVAPAGKREPGNARWVGAVDATRKACRQTPTSITVNVSAPSSRCRGPSAVAPGAWRAWPTGGRRDAKPSFYRFFPLLGVLLPAIGGRWPGHLQRLRGDRPGGNSPAPGADTLQPARRPPTQGESRAARPRPGVCGRAPNPKRRRSAAARAGVARAWRGRGAGMARAVAGGAACDDRRRSYTLRTHDAERLAAAPTVPPGGAIGVVASPPTARRGKSTAAGAP